MLEPPAELGMNKPFLRSPLREVLRDPNPLAVIKGVPAGYSRALINGRPATFNGRPVYAKFSGSTLVSLVYT